MASKALKSTHDKLASILAKRVLTKAGRTLHFIGKPVYYILSYTVLFTLFLTYITGHAARVTVKSFFEYIKNLVLDTIKSSKILIASSKESYLKTKKGVIYYHKSYHKTLKSKKRKIKKVKIDVIQITPVKKELSRYKNFLILSFLKIKLIPHKINNIKITLPIPKVRLRYVFATLFIVVFILVPSFYTYYIFRDLPSPSELTTRDLEVSTKIYDRNGILIYKIYQDKNRTIIPIEEIPQKVRLATIAAEDAEFYVHPGISIKGIARALYKNLTKGELTGGSTITQQLVKNALLTPEKTYTRKVKEVILAIQTEMTYDKDEILEMYFNEVSYGGTAYGIKEASTTYFGKEVKDLTLAEAAFLAGLPKSPTRFSPYGDNIEQALARQKDIIHLMHLNGYITKEQEEKIIAQKINFTPNKTEIKAPHFVMYTKQFLENEYGEDVVEKGGLEVVTTLDMNIQVIAEEVVRDELGKLEKLNVTNAAVVVLDPQTGEILAMVGSKDYFDIENDGNVNVTRSLRQPGSSIKVVNYAYALSNGYTAATILSDTPVSYSITGQAPYSPTNYDGGYRGNLTVRSALAESRNIPAVKLLSSYGVDNMIEMGKELGITTWEEEERFGLSLTLGGGEIKLIDLARVYATIANYGERPVLSPFLNITNYQGDVLYTNLCIYESNENKFPGTERITGIINEVGAYSQDDTCATKQVLDPRVAFIITDILKDNSARAPAFGAISQLVVFDHPEVAVKTGTSNNLKDNLTIGYNQDYVVAVWVGNNDSSPMSRVASGVTGASPIFNKIMTALLLQTEAKEWIVPPGLVQRSICPLTGTLACTGCPETTEWFLVENKPEQRCSYEYIGAKKDNKENNRYTIQQGRPHRVWP